MESSSLASQAAKSRRWVLLLTFPCGVFAVFFFELLLWLARRNTHLSFGSTTEANEGGHLMGHVLGDLGSCEVNIIAPSRPQTLRKALQRDLYILHCSLLGFSRQERTDFYFFSTY